MGREGWVNVLLVYIVHETGRHVGDKYINSCDYNREEGKEVECEICSDTQQELRAYGGIFVSLGNALIMQGGELSGDGNAFISSCGMIT